MEYINQALSRINKKARGGVILLGPKGLGQETDALLLADEVLGESHEGHPDFIKIEKGMDITSVINSSNLCVTARSSLRVFYLEDIDLCGTEVQNRLLKAFEESDAFFICTASSEVLGTIMSRLTAVFYRLPAVDDFLEKGGSLGSYYAGDDAEASELFDNICAFFSNGDRKAILDALGLVGEKESGFFEEKRSLVPALICMLGKLSYKGDNLLLARKAALFADRASSDKFTKSDLFTAVAVLI